MHTSSNRGEPPRRSRRYGLIALILLGLYMVLPLTPVLPVYAADCGQTSSGLTPLTDMVGKLYGGKEGGLYAGGNAPPAEFQAAGVETARRIRPLDKDGNSDDGNGRIGLLAIGMSVTSMEFTTFQSLAAQDPLKNPKVTMVDGALYGVAASPLANNTSELWDEVDRRVIRSGLSVKQVQVVWLKEVNSKDRGFPRDAEKLQKDLKTIVQILRERYVNLRIVYLSSRSYGGYSSIGLNPEPHAYETGFAVKWLIQAQIDRDPELSYNELNGSVKAPLLRWGPYLWADGVNPRRDNGLTWECSDFDDDGVHPSASGRMKAGKMLLNFMQTDSSARIWYLSEDAQGRTVEPLMFASPFPSTVLILLGGVAAVAIVFTVRFVSSRRKVEEVAEDEVE